MYSHILVPVDGSRLSEAVLPSAVAMATAMHASMELLHVVGKDKDSPDHISEYLMGLSRKASVSTDVRVSVEAGNPVETIVSRATGQKGTLVAMSTRGNSGVKRWLLGSTAARVLENLSSPLLLLKPTEELPSEQWPPAEFQRIQVPLDGSRLAEAILPHVVAVAQSMHLDVELLRVYSLPVTATMPAYSGAAGYAGEEQAALTEKVMESLKEEAESYLKNRKQELTAKGVKNVACLALQGDTAGQIIDTAQETPASLIAMSTHGSSGVIRHVLGSIADRVVRHSGNPVLLIRPAQN